MHYSSIESEVSNGEKSSDQLGKVTCKPNESFARKLAPGSEASSAMVGGVDFLTTTVSAFVRIKSNVIMHELSEVSIPTRFVFICLGPSNRTKDIRELGRAMETIMSDAIFMDVAYKTNTRADLLAGIDEFLDEGTALPPSEWDPKIRIEPPKKIPSSDTRKIQVIHHASSEKSLIQLDTQCKSKESLVSHSKSEIGSSLNAIMDALMKKQNEEDEAKNAHVVDPSLSRTGRLFGGLVKDVQRKLPFYKSDFVDGFNLQCLASIFFIFFACLSPIVTFGGLLGVATENHMAAFEAIITAAICGTTYHLFAGQPLTILGSTGPVLLFEKILFQFSQENGIDYLSFRFWIGMSAGTMLLLLVAFDLSALVQLITRFTEECFATLISVIFIFEAFAAINGIYKEYPVGTLANMNRNYTCWCDWVQSNYSAAYKVSAPNIDMDSFDCRELNASSCTQMKPCQTYGPGCGYNQPVPDVFFFSCVIFFGTCTLAIFLKSFRTTSFFPARVRVAS